jgi:hypothetical protein
LIVGDAAQTLERVAVSEAGEHCVERGELREKVFPKIEGLMLSGREWAAAGPTRVTQQL